MNSIKLNSEVLNDIFNDSGFYNEIFDFLNSLIDDELSKGEAADCDLIDECIELLEQLSSEDRNSTSFLVKLVSKEKFARKIKTHSLLGQKSGKKILTACAAVVLVLSIGTIYSYNTSGVSLVKSIENKLSNLLQDKRPADYTEGEAQSEETTENVSIAEIITESDVEETTKTVPDEPQQSEKKQQMISEAVQTGIHTDIPKTVKTDYIIGESLLTDGIRVYIEFSGGGKKEVPISECDITVPPEFYRDAGKYYITVAYGGFKTSYMVSVNAVKESVILNSIYGEFDEDFSFTVTDFNSVDFSKMSVIAVYSDGSEKEIESSLYLITVEPEFMGFENKELVTISYEGREFSFILTREV